MLDACIVKRDAQGSDDDTLNESTGVLARPADDATTVYTGPCRLRPTGLQERTGSEGDRYVVSKAYECAVPLSAVNVLVGDVLTLTASQDPLTLGRPFRVTAVVARTLAVQRHLRLEDRG